MMRALLLVAFFAVAPFRAFAQEGAELLPVDAEALTDEDLSAARGGFEFGGFIFDFAVRTLIAVDDATGLGAAPSESMNFAFDAATDSFVITNSIDNVAISRVVAIDVVVSNFSSVVSAASAAGVGAFFPTPYLSLGGL